MNVLQLSPTALARASRRPRRTLGAWLVTLVAAIVLIVLLLGDSLTGEGEVTNNPESDRASAILFERLPPTRDVTNELVHTGAGATRRGGRPPRA